MKDTKTIRAGIGLGDLKFGVTQEEVRAYFGDPDEVEVCDDPGHEYVVWHYAVFDGFVSFDKEDDYRFCDIETSSPTSNLEGMSLIGRDIVTVRSMIALLDLGECVEEYSDMEDAGDRRCCQLTFDDVAMNFWFTDNVLRDIQWGVLFDNEDEIIWPS